MKTLKAALGDESTAVRETTAGILGRIGLPESMSAIDHLSQIAAKDSDPNVKSFAIWALGRLGPEACPRIKNILVNGLKNSYWKVRTTSCMAVALMGPDIAQHALSTLVKLLRDGSINR